MKINIYHFSATLLSSIVFGGLVQVSTLNQPWANELPAAELLPSERAYPDKPKLENLLKTRSIKKLEDNEVVTNSEWLDSGDFAFVNGVVIRAPLRKARPQILNFNLYSQMSKAISKFEYNPKTQIIELVGEASGLKAHSWIQVKALYEDFIQYEVIAGDLKGFKVDAYLWEKAGKTLAIAKGNWPQGRKAFSWVIAQLFKPVSEIVIGEATLNFRKHIEKSFK